MHANARLTIHGRRIAVTRVRFECRPAAHVAKELGVSRQCVHRWITRYDAEGEAGLHDRSSRPHHSPTRTPAATEARVLAARRALKTGPARLSAATGVPTRTVSRILARHHVPHLGACDPISGDPIAPPATASAATSTRASGRSRWPHEGCGCRRDRVIRCIRRAHRCQR